MYSEAAAASMREKTAALAFTKLRPQHNVRITIHSGQSFLRPETRINSLECTGRFTYFYENIMQWTRDFRQTIFTQHEFEPKEGRESPFGFKMKTMSGL